MPRKGTRTRVDRNISRDGTGYSVHAAVGAGMQRRSREKRFPLVVELPFLRAQRAQLETELWEEVFQQQHHEPGRKGPARGTWSGDVETYLRRMQPRLDRATYRSRVSELKAWTVVFGAERARHQIRLSDVDRAMAAWRAASPPISPKTVQNRIRTLRHLYANLDGKRARTPADDAVLPKIVRTRPRPIDIKTIRTVIARLMKQERKGRLRDAKSRARFMVLVTTGQRPSQVKRSTPKDVDLEARMWWVPAAKGGDQVPLYLNDEMLGAWQLFITANAWGHYDTRSFARTLRESGWPADVRPYNLRHSIGIALSEGGTDLGDVQAFLSHRHIQTTRNFYVPMLMSRIKAASTALEGRLGLRARPAQYVGVALQTRADPTGAPVDRS